MAARTLCTSFAYARHADAAATLFAAHRPSGGNSTALHFVLDRVIAGGEHVAWNESDDRAAAGGGVHLLAGYSISSFPEVRLCGQPAKVTTATASRLPPVPSLQPLVASGHAAVLTH